MVEDRFLVVIVIIHVGHVRLHLLHTNIRLGGPIRIDIDLLDTQLCAAVRSRSHHLLLTLCSRSTPGDHVLHLHRRR